jgi:hypothetical protein
MASTPPEWARGMLPKTRHENCAPETAPRNSTFGAEFETQRLGSGLLNGPIPHGVRRFSPECVQRPDWVAEVADGVLGLVSSYRPIRWLRFRLMVKRGPPERPQASGGERSHETVCRIRRVGERDQRVHR